MKSKDYMRLYKDLVDIATDKGLKVRFVPYIKGGYIGMNDLAAKSHGIVLPRKTILIKSSMSAKRKLHTLEHEIIERGRMAARWSYRRAHKYALVHESDFG